MCLPKPPPPTFGEFGRESREAAPWLCLPTAALQLLSPSRLVPWALRGTAPSQRGAGGRLFSPADAFMPRGHGCCRGKGASGRDEPLHQGMVRGQHWAGSSPSMLSPSFPPLPITGTAHGSTQDPFWAQHSEAGAERGWRRDVSLSMQPWVSSTAVPLGLTTGGGFVCLCDRAALGLWFYSGTHLILLTPPATRPCTLPWGL